MSEAVARLVAVMDRLRSPGGCPWDAEQTHTSLVPYLLEETYELAEAVDAGDRPGLREELGDVLLQVVFHARVAQDDLDDPFDLDDVADALTAKLVRRHPHVFADQAVAADGLHTRSGREVVRSSEPTEGGSTTREAPHSDTAGVPRTLGSDERSEQHARWDRLKRAEKTSRTSALDGVPAALPALTRAQKLAGRARRAGLGDVCPDDAAGTDADAALGQTLLTLALAHPDLDAEGALRRATRRWEGRVREVETVRLGGSDVHGRSY